jgi:protein transport protein HofC
VAGLIELLQQGFSLTKALRTYPDLVSQEVFLALSLGEVTGNFSSCLSIIGRWQKDLFWLTVLPRMAYLFFMVISTLNVAVFFMVFIAPKFERIFKDFDYSLPWATLLLFKFFNWLPTFGQKGNVIADFAPGVWIALVVLVPVIVALPFWNMTARWYFPIVGSIYRVHLQGSFLKMMGITLQGQVVVSKALTFLEESKCFSGPSQKQLVKLNSSIKLGHSLEDSLDASGWLPKSMKPLVQSAQKVNNLPWALEEIGNQRLRLASLFAQRFSLVVFPLLMLLLGVMVGFIAIAMFMPLIKMMVELS